MYISCSSNHGSEKRFAHHTNAFFLLHLVAIGMSGFCCVWLALFPISPTRLYNMQVDVFNTNHEHTNFFFKQCLYLGNVFGAAAAGYLGDKLGRAGALELAAIPYIIGWLLVGLSYGEVTVLIGRYLLGVAAGMIAVVAPIYLAEVSAAKTRGRVLCVQALVAGLGRLCYLAIGALFIFLSRSYFGFNLSEWKILALIGVLPGMVLLLLIQRLPDSPTWLVVKHDDRDSAFDVQLALANGNYKSAEFHVNSIIHANILAKEDRTHHGAFFRPLLLCCALFTLRAVSAYLIEPTLSATSSDAYRLAVLGLELDLGEVDLLYVISFMWIAASVGMLCCFALIDTSGRLMTMRAGCYLAASCSLVLLLSAYKVKQTGLVNAAVINCDSAVMLLIIAGHQLGLGVGSVVLVSELFPAKQRMGAASLVFIWDGLVNLALSYLVPLIGRVFSSPSDVFGVCAALVLLCHVLGAVISWLYLPETSQRSLQEIEAILSGWPPATPRFSSSRVRLGSEYGSTAAQQ